MTERAATLEQIHREIHACTACVLHETRTHAVPGEGPVDAQIMFVGEGPGEVNDREGRPFVGHGGRIFDGLLERVGLSRADVYITNAVKCWPPGNRRPRVREMKACRGFLLRQISLVNPRLIIALGTAAFRAVSGRNVVLRDAHGSVVRVDGRLICPMFHPNALRYIKGGMATLEADLRNAVTALEDESLADSDCSKS